MFKHVLIPTDESTLSTEAAIKAIEFAKSQGARATALMVVEPLPAGRQGEAARRDFDSGVEAQADAVLAAVAVRGKAAGVDLATQKAGGDDPHAAIIAAAEAQGCDVIAMGSHGRTGATAMLGSQTLKVLTHSKIPVLVFR
jgi:nucleotide-binding universal stress UspA family protein